MPTFTVEQSTAARAFLGWSQRDLGEASGLAFKTIRNAERDGASAIAKSIAAFHDGGVHFYNMGSRVDINAVVQCDPW